MINYVKTRRILFTLRSFFRTFVRYNLIIKTNGKAK